MHSYVIYFTFFTLLNPWRLFMQEALLSLVTTTALLLGSPGPAPLALAATGATGGLRRGLPFLGGILCGLSVAIVFAAVGLTALFTALPEARWLLQWVGGAYIVYVAFKIATARPNAAQGEANTLPGWRDGFIINLLNPKAYAAFLAIFAQWLLPFERAWLAITVTALICLLVASVVDFIWLWLGSLLTPLLAKPRLGRAIRFGFAGLMLVAVGYALWPTS